MKKIKILLITNIFIIILFGCSKKTLQKEYYYQVTGHKTDSGEWTILYVDNKKHTKTQFIVVCDFYKWGTHETVNGPSSCELTVGEKLITNAFPKQPENFLDIWRSGDTLFITRGKGTEQIHQQFSIKSIKLL